MRRHLVNTRSLVPAILALAVAAGACKPPRSPRDHAQESVTGAWTSRSAAPGAPRDTGTVAWTLRLEERQAGKLTGGGLMSRGSDSSPFAASGVRGKDEITLHFDLAGERVKYHGGIMGFKTSPASSTCRTTPFP